MKTVFFIPFRKTPIRCSALSRYHLRYIYMGGILLTATALLVRILSVPSYQIYFLARQLRSIPPFWLLMAIHLVFMFVMGATVGVILSDCRPYVYAAKYRAGMLFVLQITLYLAIYPLIFHSLTPWIALFILILALILSIVCFLQFYTIRRLCGLIATLFSCWLFYLFLLLLGTLLQI